MVHYITEGKFLENFKPVVVKKMGCFLSSFRILLHSRNSESTVILILIIALIVAGALASLLLNRSLTLLNEKLLFQDGCNARVRAAEVSFL